MSQHDDNMDVDNAAGDETRTTTKHRKTEADHIRTGSAPGGAIVQTSRKWSRLTAKSGTRRPTIAVTGSGQNASSIAALNYVEAERKGLLLKPGEKSDDGRECRKDDPKEHENTLIDFKPLEELFDESVPASEAAKNLAHLHQTRRAHTSSMVNAISRFGARNGGKGIAIGALGSPVACSANIVASPEGQKVLDMKVSDVKNLSNRFDNISEPEDLTVGQLLHVAVFAATARQFKTVQDRLTEISGESYSRKRERPADDEEEDAPAEKKAAVADTKGTKAVDKKTKPAPKKAAADDEEDEAPKKPAAKKAAPKKVADEEEDEAPKKPAAKKAAPKKAAPVADDDDDADEAPKKAPAPKKTAAPKKAAASKKADDEESEETAAPAKPAPKKIVASADW